MRFIFSAPFRTGINLKSLEGFDSYEDLLTILNEAVCDELTNKLPSGCSWQVPWADYKSGELHYSSLTEDRLPLSAMPLLKLTISEKIVQETLKTLTAGFKFQHIAIHNSYAEYFDNTVGILNVDLSIEQEVSEVEVLANIDYFSTQFCSRLINQVKCYQEEIRKRLCREHAVFLRPEEFTVFFDRRNIKTIDEMLWVTRVYLNANENKIVNLLNDWTHQPNVLEIQTPFGEGKASICVGNSVVFGELSNSDELALKTSLSLSTYFYVLFDVLNRNLKTLFLQVTSKPKLSSLDLNKVNKIRTHIEFIENEFGDVIMGLQGQRNFMSKLLLETWNYDALLKAVHQKKNTVGKLVEFKLQERQSRYGRFIESILAAIGGVAILDFTLNLFAFANSEDLSKSSEFSLIAMTKLISIDRALNLILIFILFILILVLRKK